MHYPIFWVASSLSAGIALGKIVSPHISSILPTLAVSIVLLLFSILFREYRKRFWSCFLLGILFVGQVLHWYRFDSLKKNPLTGSLTVIGIVNSNPIHFRSNYGLKKSKFRFKCVNYRKAEEEWKIIDQNIIVNLLESDASPQYGDKLLLEGEILKAVTKNPGSFNSESYLESQSIVGRFYVRKSNDFMIVSNGHGNPIISKIFQLKNFLLKMIDEKIPAPERSVVKGVLLGDREEIVFDIQDDFAKSGTAHILAISGLNVSLIATIFISIFRIIRFPVRVSYAFAMIFLSAYCMLTGSSASVVRATLMINLFLFGFVIKRESEIITSLSWSAILILIFEPFQLFDPGFQLTYLTILSLLMLSPSWQSFKDESTDFDFEDSKLMKRIQLRKILIYIRNSFGISFAAWVGILPVIAYYFFLFSPITLLANLFVVPYSWVITAGGFAFLLLGSFGEFFREILGSAMWFFTKVLILMCHWFSTIPYGHFRVSPPSLFDFIIFYGMILIWLFRDTLKTDKKRFLMILLFITNVFVWKGVFHSGRCHGLASGFWSSTPPRAEWRPEGSSLDSTSKNLKITCLDVGHGDSAFIEFPQKGNLLVDTGAGRDWDQGRMVVAPFLWSRGITHLDGILITHPDLDHCGGLKYLLDEFSVGAVFDNGVRNSEFYEEIFREKKLERKGLKSGEIISGTDEAKIFVMHPPKNFLKDSAVGGNDQSLVFQLRYKDMKFLFSGDAEKIAFQELSRYGKKLESHVLKAPHHGSYEKEESENFFSQVKPEIVIISEAERNRFNLPSKKTVSFINQLGAKIYQTGLTGAIEFVTDGTTYTIKTMLRN